MNTFLIWYRYHSTPRRSPRLRRVIFHLRRARNPRRNRPPSPRHQSRSRHKRCLRDREEALHHNICAVRDGWWEGRAPGKLSWEVKRGNEADVDEGPRATEVWRVVLEELGLFGGDSQWGTRREVVFAVGELDRADKWFRSVEVMIEGLVVVG